MYQRDDAHSFHNFCRRIGLILSISFNKHLRRWWYGYDSCENLCGFKNVRISFRPEDCKPEDYRDFPVVLYANVTTTCVKLADCKPSDFNLFFGRCFPKDSLPEETIKVQKYFEIISNTWKARYAITVMVFAALGLILLIYGLFRVSAKFTFMALIIVMTSLSAVITIGFWSTYFLKQGRPYLMPSIVSLIYLIPFLVLLHFLRKYFFLMARLYRETVRIIFQAPITLVQPLITILFVFILDAIIIYLLLLLYAVEGKITYSTELKVLNTLFISVVMFWLFAFANGCQCLIVSGVIQAYFFARNKSTLCCPYFFTLWMGLHYHLGTIATGALVITILRILKPLTECFGNRPHTGFCGVVAVCSEWLREMSDYLTRKAYIMTALHGRGIFKSGRRAVRLLWLFLCDTIIIDELACIFMHALSFFIMLCGIILGIVIILPLKVKYIYVPVVLGVCLAGTVTFFYVSVMNVAIETLFLCFCEDRFLNTGNRDNPYFMTPEFYTLMIDALEMAYGGELGHRTYSDN
ncbi:choline transporter-like protein 2 isoform X2 [Tribolium castaneum]|uniref:choline transporter-like protein 2 isoform X2 n=1 Tax=Tribolium castaneum TaxID=7070 RepID=UPI00077DE52D|nr:PREDICTED: choline transporter-like protein 2 isoform X2 [Tribolium castaneum]|eukprot:XP_015833332.1 PREDICTED: choline transporter-like protein 2 isoform X2 [Tribolium castaneum]